MTELYAGQGFEDRTQLLSRFKTDYPQYQSWGDQTLYSTLVKNDPTLETRVKQNAAPDYRTSKDLLAAFREWNPSYRELDDATLGQGLVDQMPELSVFGIGKARAPREPAEPQVVVSPFEAEFRSRYPQWIGPLPKSDISGLRGAQAYQEVMAANQRGRAGFGEGFVSNWESIIPFYGTVTAAIDVGKLALTARRLQSGEDVSDQELLDLNIYLADNDRASNATWLGKAGNVFATSIGFAGEFAAVSLAGAGAGALATKGATQTGKTVLQRMAANFAKKRVWDAAATSVEKSAGRALTKRVGLAAAERFVKTGGSQELAEQVGRKAAEKFAASKAYRAVTGAAGALTRAAVGGAIQTGATVGAQLAATAGEEGGPTTAAIAETELYAALSDQPMSKARAVGIGLLKDYIERSSEFTGDALLNAAWLPLPGAWHEKFLKFAGEEGLTRLAANIAVRGSREAVEEVAKKAQAKTVMGAFLVDFARKHSLNFKEAAKTLKRVGYDGVLQEMAEERLGGALHGLFGTDGSEGGLRAAIEGALPSTDEALAELLAFSLPMAMLKTADVTQKKLAGVFGNDVAGFVNATRRVLGRDIGDTQYVTVDTPEGPKREGVPTPTMSSAEGKQAEDYLVPMARSLSEMEPSASRFVDFAMSLLTFPLHWDPTRMMYGTMERALMAEGLPNFVELYRGLVKSQVARGLSETAAKDAADTILKASIPAVLAGKVAIRADMDAELQKEIQDKIVPGSVLQLGHYGTVVREAKEKPFTAKLTEELVRQGHLIVRPAVDRAPLDIKETQALEDLITKFEGFDSMDEAGQTRLIELAVTSGLMGANPFVDIKKPNFVENIRRHFGVARALRDLYKNQSLRRGMQVRQGVNNFVVTNIDGDAVTLRPLSGGPEFAASAKQIGDGANQEFSLVVPNVMLDRSMILGTRAQLEKLAVMQAYDFNEVARKVEAIQNPDGTVEDVYAISAGVTNAVDSMGTPILRWRPESGPYHLAEDSLEMWARALHGEVWRGPGVLQALDRLTAELGVLRDKQKAEADPTGTNTAKGVEASRKIEALLKTLRRHQGESNLDYGRRVADEKFFKLALQMEAGYDYANFGAIQLLPYHGLYAMLKNEYAAAWQAARQDFMGAMEQTVGAGWQELLMNPFMGVATVSAAEVAELASKSVGAAGVKEKAAGLRKDAAEQRDAGRKAARDASRAPAPSAKVETPVRVPEPSKTIPGAASAPPPRAKTPAAGTPAAGTPAGAPAGTPAGTPAGAPAGTPAGTPAGAPAGTPAGAPAGAPAGTPAAGAPAAGTPAEAPVARTPGARRAQVSRGRSDYNDIDGLLDKGGQGSLLASKTLGRRVGDYLTYLEHAGDLRIPGWGDLMTALREADPEEVEGLLDEAVEMETRVGFLKMPPDLLRGALRYLYRNEAPVYVEALKTHGQLMSEIEGDFDRAFGVSAEENQASEYNEDQESTTGSLDEYFEDRRLKADLNAPELAVFTAVVRNFFPETQTHVAVARAYREHRDVLNKAIETPESFEAFRKQDLGTDAAPELIALHTALSYVPYMDAIQVYSKWLMPVVSRPGVHVRMSSDGSNVAKVVIMRSQNSSRMLDKVERTLSAVFNDANRLAGLRSRVEEADLALKSKDTDAVGLTAVELLRYMTDEFANGGSAATAWNRVAAALRREDATVMDPRAALTALVQGLKGFVLDKADRPDWGSQWRSALNKILFGGTLQMGTDRAYNESGMPLTNPGSSALTTLIGLTNQYEFAESIVKPASRSRGTGYGFESAMNAPGMLRVMEAFGVVHELPDTEIDPDAETLDPIDAENLSAAARAALQRRLYDYALQRDKEGRLRNPELGFLFLPFNGAKPNVDLVEIPRDRVLNADGTAPDFETAWRRMSEAYLGQFALPSTTKELVSLLLKRMDKFRSGGWQYVPVQGGVGKTKNVIILDAKSKELPTMFDGAEYSTPTHAERQKLSLGLHEAFAIKSGVVARRDEDRVQYYDKSVKLLEATPEHQPFVDAAAKAGYDSVTDSDSIKAFDRSDEVFLNVVTPDGRTLKYKGWRVEAPMEQERVTALLDKATRSHDGVLPLPAASYGLANHGGQGGRLAAAANRAVHDAMVFQSDTPVKLSEELQPNLHFTRAAVERLGNNRAIVYPGTRGIAEPVAASQIRQVGLHAQVLQSVVVPSAVADTDAVGASYYSDPVRLPDGRVRAARARANISDPGFRYESVVVPGVTRDALVAVLKRLAPNADPAGMPGARQVLAGMLTYRWEGEDIEVPATVNFEDLFDAAGNLLEQEIYDGADIPAYLRGADVTLVLGAAGRMFSRTPDGPNAHRYMRVSAPRTFARGRNGKLRPGPQNWHSFSNPLRLKAGIDMDADKDAVWAGRMVKDSLRGGYVFARPPSDIAIGAAEPGNKYTEEDVARLKAAAAHAYYQAAVDAYYLASDWDLDMAIDVGFLQDVKTRWDNKVVRVGDLTESGLLPAEGGREDILKAFHDFDTWQRLSEVSLSSLSLRGAMVAYYAAAQLTLRHLGLAYRGAPTTVGFTNRLTGRREKIVVARPQARPENDRILAYAMSNFISFAVDDPSKPQTAFLKMTPDNMALFLAMAAGQDFKATTYKDALEEIRGFYQTFLGFLDSQEMDDLRAAEAKYIDGKQSLIKTRRTPTGDVQDVFKGRQAVLESLKGPEGQLPAVVEAFQKYTALGKQISGITQALLVIKKKPGDLARLDRLQSNLADLAGSQTVSVKDFNDPLILTAQSVLRLYDAVFRAAESPFRQPFVEALAGAAVTRKKSMAWDAAKPPEVQERPYGGLSTGQWRRFEAAVERAYLLEALADRLAPEARAALWAATRRNPMLRAQLNETQGDLPRVAIRNVALAVAKAAIATSGRTLNADGSVAQPGNAWWQRVRVAQQGAKGSPQVIAFMVRQDDSLTAARAAELADAFDRTGDNWEGGMLEVDLRLSKKIDAPASVRFTPDEVKTIMTWYAVSGEGTRSRTIDTQLLSSMSPAWHDGLATAYIEAARQKQSTVLADQILALYRNPQKDYVPTAFQDLAVPMSTLAFEQAGNRISGPGFVRPQPSASTRPPAAPAARPPATPVARPPAAPRAPAVPADAGSPRQPSFDIVYLNFRQDTPVGVINGMRGPRGETISSVKPEDYGKPNSGWLGNPFKSRDAGGLYSREQATEKFREVFLKKVESDPAYRAAVLALRGQKIGYYKPGESIIHLHVVQEWLAAQPVTPAAETPAAETPAPAVGFVATPRAGAPQAEQVKARYKARRATAYIGDGAGSTGLYRQQAEAQGISVNKEAYTPQDVVFASVNGSPTMENLNNTERRVRAALDAGAVVLLDSEEYLKSSTYNQGEKALAKRLLDAGYVRQTSKELGTVGEWRKQGPKRYELPLTQSDKDFILNQILSEAVPAKPGEQRLLLTGGPPAAGKSSAVRALGLDTRSWIIADADALKVRMGHEDNARAAHEDSSLLNKTLADQALAKNYNLVYDSLLTSYKQADRLISAALDRGAKVDLTFVNTGLLASVARTISRVLSGDTRREIPHDALVKAYRYALPTFFALTRKYGSKIDWSLSSVDRADSLLEPVARQQNGRVTVVNPLAYGRLLAVSYTQRLMKGETRFERTDLRTLDDIRAHRGAILSAVQGILARRGTTRTGLLETATQLFERGGSELGSNGPSEQSVREDVSRSGPDRVNVVEDAEVSAEAFRDALETSSERVPEDAPARDAVEPEAPAAPALEPLPQDLQITAEHQYEIGVLTAGVEYMVRYRKDGRVTYVAPRRRDDARREEHERVRDLLKGRDLSEILAAAAPMTPRDRVEAPPVQETGFLPSAVVPGKMLLSTGAMVPATRGQDRALTALDGLARDALSGGRPRGQTAVVIGRPGVGKTASLNEALRRIRLYYGSRSKPIPAEVLIATPTHMASGVAAMLTTFWQKSAISDIAKSVRPEVLTVAAMLGQRETPPRDSRTGAVKDGWEQIGDRYYLDPKAAINERYPPKIAGAKLLIVDEASMITRGEVELLQRWQKLTGVNVVFMGDSAQLPAVSKVAAAGTESADIGPVFKADFATTRIELDEVMRQGRDNPLVQVLETVRAAIFSQDKSAAAKAITLPIAESISESGEGYATVPSVNAVVQALGDSLTPELFRRAPHALRFYSPTNFGVRQWNEVLYRKLFPGSERQVEPGTLVRAYVTFNPESFGDRGSQASALVSHVHSDAAYENSDDFIVTAVGEEREFGGPVGALSKLKGVFVDLERAEPGIALTGKRTHRVFLTNKDQGRLLLAVVNSIRTQMDAAFRSRNWDEGYALKDTLHAVSSLVVSFNSLTPAGAADAEIGSRSGLSKAMDLGYAATVHKGQGSTNLIAVMDAGGVEAATKFGVFTRLQLLYVGLSRASKTGLAISRGSTQQLSAKSVTALKALLDAARTESRAPDAVENADDYGRGEQASLLAGETVERESGELASLVAVTPLRQTPEIPDVDRIPGFGDRDRYLIHTLGESASLVSAIWNSNWARHRGRHLGLIGAPASMQRALIAEDDASRARKDFGLSEINRDKIVYGDTQDGILYEIIDTDQVKRGERPLLARGSRKELGRLSETERDQAGMVRWAAAALREHREGDAFVVQDILDRTDIDDAQKRELIEPYLDRALVTWGHEVRDPHDPTGETFLAPQEVVRAAILRFASSAARTKLVAAGRTDAMLDWYDNLKGLDAFYNSFSADIMRQRGYVEHRYGVGFADQFTRAADAEVTRDLNATAVPAVAEPLKDDAFVKPTGAQVLEPTAQQIELYNELTGEKFDDKIMQAHGITRVDLNHILHAELYKNAVMLARQRINKSEAYDDARYQRYVNLIRKLRSVLNQYELREWAPPMMPRKFQGSFASIFRQTLPKPGRKGFARAPRTMDFIGLKQQYLLKVVAAERNRAVARELVLTQDEDGLPGVVMIPSEGADVMPLLPKGILIEMGARWAAALNRRFDPTGNIRGQLITLSESLNPAEFETFASPFPSVDRILTRRGDASQVVKHWIEQPRRFLVGGVDVLEQLMRLTQWGKMLGVGHSLFLATSITESGVAGSGFGNNVLWGKDLTGTYKGRGPLPAFRKVRDIAMLQASGDPEFTKLLYRYSMAGIQLGGEQILDNASGVFDRDLESIVNAIGETYGEAWKTRARVATRTLTGRWLSERYFGKPGVRGGLFQASKIYFADQMARQIAREQGENWDDLTEGSQIEILKSIAQFINAAYGEDNWKRYLWSTPKVVQIMNLMLFAPQWTWAALNVGGGGMLTGALMGNPMTGITRRLIARNTLAMFTIVLGAIPAVMQLTAFLLGKAAGNDDPDDRPFPEQNEEGRQTYIDVTPVMRGLPWYRGDPTGKRRVFIRFGKQAWEVYNGWLTKPWATFLGKMSVPAKIVFEQITGKSPGSDWTLEFSGRGLAGWISAIDRDGEKSFLKSRLGYIAQKYFPMSSMSAIQNQDAAVFSFVAPISQGASAGKATAELIVVLNTVAQDSTWRYARRTPGIVENLQGLGARQLDMAARNGFDVDKIVTTAKGVVLGRLYKEFSAALNDNDEVAMNKIANRILRVGGTLRGLKTSMKSRLATAGKEPTAEELAAMEQAMSSD